MAGAEGTKTSELAVRAATAFLMVMVSGLALWLGGIWWVVFVLLIGAGVWFEWSTLSILMYPPGGKRTAWRAGGAIYCGIAAGMLLTLRDLPYGFFWVLLVVGAVIGTDIGAYFLGRIIGGPKIAPAISPSKTWAGLAGGICGASLIIAWLASLLDNPGFLAFVADSQSAPHDTYEMQLHPFASGSSMVLTGAVVAVIAQTGDFFESWMKRRAGVKDSGKLLPGHGGLFDRGDGLLSVLAVLGTIFLVARLTGAM